MKFLTAAVGLLCADYAQADITVTWYSDQYWYTESSSYVIEDNDHGAWSADFCYNWDVYVVNGERYDDVSGHWEGYLNVPES